jgi:hypothetical protein
MLVYKKTKELAEKFEAVYPPDLPARLHWWSKALGIDPVRLLRLLGMSAEQAAQHKSEDLKEILNNPAWQENAWRVEGILHRLLALFHYDWQALAERLHATAARPETEEPSRVTRRPGQGERLEYASQGDPSDLLLKRLTQGGRQALSALWAYLALPQTSASRTAS